MLETKLLSKVLIEKDFQVLRKFNVTGDDMVNERKVYNFIKGHVEEYAQVPSFDAVIEAVPNFNAQTEVYDTFPYLCKTLKKKRAKKAVFDVLQNKAGEKYETEHVDTFLDWISKEVDSIKTITQNSSGLGTNYGTNGADRRARYEETKLNGSDVIIEMPYASLNKAMDGGPTLTDYLLIQAFTNVGKSWLASDICVHAWKVGGNGVLHYSPELSKQQQENRNDTLLGHYNNIDLRTGNLDNEESYYRFLDGFKDNEVPYIIKTMEDLPNGLSIDTIEADLQMNPNIRVVLIDGFNLMNHGRGDRNAMSQTSRSLRQLFGKYNVLGIIVHQVSAGAEKEKGKGKDEEGSPVPNPAGLLGFSETSAVIQDAAHVLSFDAVNGYGKLYLPKTRGTGKETTIDLNCNFNMGYIKEASPVDHF